MSKVNYSVCTECKKFRKIHHVVKLSPKSAKVLEKLCLQCFDKVFVD